MEQLALETKMDLFKWKQYESAIILLTVRWHLKYSLSYRDIVEMTKPISKLKVSGSIYTEPLILWGKPLISCYLKIEICRQLSASLQSFVLST